MAKYSATYEKLMPLWQEFRKWTRNKALNEQTNKQIDEIPIELLPFIPEISLLLYSLGFNNIITFILLFKGNL